MAIENKTEFLKELYKKESLPSKNPLETHSSEIIIKITNGSIIKDHYSIKLSGWVIF